MKKTYYFSHDGNARNDEKLLAVRMKYKWDGYGLFWAIVEKLSESTDYKLSKDYNLIAFDLRTDASIVKSLIEDFGLFVFTDDGKYFYSERLQRSMDFKETKSKKASENAISRFGKQNSDGYILNTTGELRYNCPQVYVIICSNTDEKFVKVGLTSEYISRRYSSNMPYQFEIFLQIFTTYNLEVEKELHELLKNYSYSPKLNFRGKLECYTIDCLSIINEYKPSFEIEKIHTAKRGQCEGNAIKVNETKEKESKINQTKEKEIPPDVVCDISILDFEKFFLFCLDKLNIKKDFRKSRILELCDLVSVECRLNEKKWLRIKPRRKIEDIWQRATWAIIEAATLHEWTHDKINLGTIITKFDELVEMVHVDQDGKVGYQVKSDKPIYQMK